MIKLTVKSLAIVLLAQGCGDASQTLSKLTGGSSGKSGSAKLSSEMPILDETAEPDATEADNIAIQTVAAEPAPEVVEPENQAVEIEAAPVSEAKAVFNAAGIETYLIEGETRSICYTRVRDQSAAEAAIEQVKTMQGNAVSWDLLLRPNEEILTANGFQSPPPSVQDILNARDVYDYELQGGVITVFESQERSALSALDVLNVFYPNISWSVVTKPIPPAPEPTPEPETP